KGALRRPFLLLDCLESFPDGVEDPVDLRFLDDERRREGEDVAGPADQYARFEDLEEGFVGALAGRAGPRLELDRAHQADVAHVDDMAAALEGVQAVLEVLLE